MGPLEDEESLNNGNSIKKNMNAELSNFATQQIDSQFFPGDGLGGEGADDYIYLTSTMPVDDTYLLDDAFETQLVNLAGETQVIDHVGETQALDDFDSMKNFPIECLYEFNAEVDAVSDSEGANKTQPLYQTQKFSEDDPVKIDGGDSVGKEKTVDIYSAKRGENVSGAPSNTCSNEEHSSGSVCGGFTSIRAASMRASGLAAQARRTNKILHSTSSDKSSLEHQTLEQDGSSHVGYLSNSVRKHDEECGKKEEKEGVRELKDASKCKVGGRAARKLFTEEDNIDMPELLASENCLAGLSYVNSQEPGELSQANALEVVDRFLDLNVVEFDEGFDSRVHIAEKPKVVSVAKGSRELAKSSILKSKDGESGVYDWDDTREDEGGGDFFLKKKELFFDKEGIKQRSLTKSIGDHEDEKEKKLSKEKIGDLLLHKLRAKGKTVYREEEVFHKNLSKDFDDVASTHTLADNDTSKDIHGMANIGPDTQMAAEVMETLCFDNVNLAENYFGGPSRCASNTTKATKKNKSSNRTACPEQHLTQKLPCAASVGVVTRQGKQIQMTSVNASNESSLMSKQSQNNKGHDTLPVARRTRKSTEISRLKTTDSSFDSRGEINDLISDRILRKRRISAEDKCAETGRGRQVGSIGFKQSNKARDGPSGASDVDKVEDLKRKRTRQEMLSVGHDADSQCNSRLKRSRNVAASIIANPGRNYATRSKKVLLEKTVVKEKSTNKADDCDHVSVKTSSSDAIDPSKSKQCDAEISAEGDRERCATPAPCTTPINKASPICMGDEYYKQSCRKNRTRLSLIKEIDKLVTVTPGPYDGSKHLRKRKDITSIRVLFSQHLDVDVVKQQQKILARMGGVAASSMSDATHFVADEFVRTRNMLEAIACGKPVVTHIWLDSCVQASCLIDEKNYILRDARKEKEFGFCLPDSLSRACQHPLLQGQKVLVTPNTKPGKDILANLVKAVRGMAVERLGRSALNDEKLPDNLLILSCEEDYDICVPFLEKGGAVYSSELLLNGIVKQKLEYERHRLFADHVKRTRSTIWVKKKSRYLPVTKCK
ncbi:hypothetical protein BUALT_Bualt12G0125800 [Buddleja alternifolia]|uniref:BRCT domain-containing protein n=1 Tax=Buddleja alternifolia TaxID=168488 RepID=A0AAV6WRB6_9LAMI|nr:hypothetical protein BUALT_Bualt12G0125800 [Buddleja alternifolia]